MPINNHALSAAADECGGTVKSQAADAFVTAIEKLGREGRWRDVGNQLWPVYLRGDCCDDPSLMRHLCTGLFMQGRQAEAERATRSYAKVISGERCKKEILAGLGISIAIHSLGHSTVQAMREAISHSLSQNNIAQAKSIAARWRGRAQKYQAAEASILAARAGGSDTHHHRPVMRFSIGRRGRAIAKTF